MFAKLGRLILVLGVVFGYIWSTGLPIPDPMPGQQGSVGADYSA